MYSAAGTFFDAIPWKESLRFDESNAVPHVFEGRQLASNALN